MIEILGKVEFEDVNIGEVFTSLEFGYSIINYKVNSKEFFILATTSPAFSDDIGQIYPGDFLTDSHRLSKTTQRLYFERI